MASLQIPVLRHAKCVDEATSVVAPGVAVIAVGRRPEASAALDLVLEMNGCAD